MRERAGCVPAALGDAGAAVGDRVRLRRPGDEPFPVPAGAVGVVVPPTPRSGFVRVRWRYGEREVSAPYVAAELGPVAEEGGDGGA